MMQLYGTNQSFIVELGFLGVPSDEDHQRYVNTYGVISNFVDSKMVDIPLAVLGSERGSQIVFSVI